MKNNSVPFILKLLLASGLAAIVLPVGAQIPPMPTAFYGVDLPEGVPAVQQERAYTSPIWYTPGK